MNMPGVEEYRFPRAGNLDKFFLPVDSTAFSGLSLQLEDDSLIVVHIVGY
jgi:hypothetical protein